MTDHHDWADHHDAGHHDAGDPAFHDEAPHLDDPQPYDDHHTGDLDEPDYLHHHPDTAEPDHDDQPAYEHTPDITDTHDPAPAADITDHDLIDTEPEFPPAVDVGPLPEPVDGFPWIDTGSLGIVDTGALHSPVEPVDPHELADYAATELPPGADPWATLAESDDPATAALARWWAENQQ
jgi:hypothetical protein